VESWAERIERLLERVPTRAAPFSSLLAALADGGEAVSGQEDRILQQVADGQRGLKVIPDRLGPWLEWPYPGPAPSCPGRAGMGDPWIVACHPPSRGEGTDQGRFVGRMRESLLAWGRNVDDGSQVAVARWIGANGEAEKALGRFLTPPARRG